MPELPEVETVRRGLKELVVGKTIAQMSCRYPKIIVTGLKEMESHLPNQTIQDVKRRGKYLIFQLTDFVLLSHLRMEGKYFYYEDLVPERKHAHVFFKFTDGTTLVYEDVRKFGTMELLEKVDLPAYFKKKRLGPEPTVEDFDLTTFAKKVVQSKKPIKSYLLDQTLVVGLGNIYVDEVLWRAKIHPARPSFSLCESEITALHEGIIAVLKQAIEKGGSTIRSYSNAFGENGSMQDYHMVYQKTNKPCPRCGTPIEKMKLGGRGSHFCPHCQQVLL